MALDPELAAKMAPGFDPIPLAKTLLRATRAGALATLTPEGAPFASLTSVATDSDGTPLILISRLAAHTLHLERDPRCSLLLSQTGKGDPLAHPRLTLVARGRRIDRDSGDGLRIRQRFLSRHPKAELYADFPDFSFWRLDLQHVSLNGGFARAWEGAPGEVLTGLAGADELLGMEAGAIDHMNEDHAEALSLYATRLCGQAAGLWRATGIDPDGMDLSAGDRTARLFFEARITDGAGLRRHLAELAARARAAQG